MVVLLIDTIHFYIHSAFYENFQTSMIIIEMTCEMEYKSLASKDHDTTFE